MNINNLILFFKNRPYLFLLGIAIFVLLIFRFLLFPGEILQPSGTTWQGITPGKTNEKELLQKMGQPITEQTEGQRKNYFFASENRLRPNQIIITNDKVVFIKEQIITPQTKELDRYISQYGPPDAVLYGPYSDLFFDAYVFLKTGLVLMADKNTGGIIEVWYFIPTAMENFLQSWGKELSGTKEVKF